MAGAAAAQAAGHAPPPAAADPRRPPSRELEMSVADGFTLAAVGDLIPSHALTPIARSDRGLAAIVEILQAADAAFGNLETTLIDMRRFEGHPAGGADDWLLAADPAVALDLRRLGFDLVSRANNHATDWGSEGLRETSRLLDEAGVAHAGAGEHRAAARAARYLDTPKGRIALVSVASTFLEAGRALPPHLQAPGRPGVSALRVKRTLALPEPAMRQLAAVAQALREGARGCGQEEEPLASVQAPAGLPEELTLLGARFERGEDPAIRYEMDPLDLREILAAVRQGKQHADFLIATIHAHETGLDCEKPGDFLPDLAHAAIEAGADAFLGHGQHHLMPIEIYRGKPIFYGLGNFIWSDIQEPLGADMHERSRDRVARAFADPAQATEADLTALWNAASFTDERVFQSVIAECRFAGGRLAEIRLHPVDLRYGERLTRSGLPRPAESQAGAAILDRLRRLSEPFGTRIAVEKGVGVIRP
jgi:poly-gamma-glutamate synthesis protein (capsule biosynthesis protein)